MDPEYTPDLFGEWVHRLRRQLDLTQIDLAQLVGCAAVTIHKIEAGERRPSRQIAERLADQLRVSPELRGRFLVAARQRLGFVDVEDWAAAFHMGDVPQPERSIAVRQLPIPPNGLIGREQVIADLRAILRNRETRLLTLVGSAGIGKTRLALAVAHELADPMQEGQNAYPDGIWWVNLAPLHDKELIPIAIAQAAGIPPVTGVTLRGYLLTWLTKRRALLILDNCEYLLDPIADLVADILTSCPGVRLIATSRALLRLQAEVAYPVPPLNSADAIALFVARARAAWFGFAITGSAEVEHVSAVCAQLDRLPFAIELAASRVRLLGLAGMQLQLESHALDVLSSSSRDSGAHHQTMRAALQGSYDLLDPVEQSVLCQLSVFRGSWTYAAAEAVCRMEPHRDVRELVLGAVSVANTTSVRAGGNLDAGMFDLLGELLDCSMIQRLSGFDDEPRFELLMLVRQFALEKLGGSNRSQAVHWRHAAYFADLAAQQRTLIPGPAAGDWFAKAMQMARPLGGEALQSALFYNSLAKAVHGDSIQADALADEGVALARAIGKPWVLGSSLEAQAVAALMVGELNRAGVALIEGLECYRKTSDRFHLAHILLCLGTIHLLRGEYRQAEIYLTEVLANTQDLPLRWRAATAELCLARIALDQGLYEQADAHSHAALAAWRELNDPHGVAAGVAIRALAVLAQGDEATASAQVHEIHDFAEQGWPAAHVEFVPILWLLPRPARMAGLVRAYSGDCAGGIARIEQALTIPQLPIYQPEIAQVLSDLGHAHVLAADYSAALGRLRPALAVFTRMEARPLIARALDDVAACRMARGEAAAAVRLCGAAESLREQIGAVLWPIDRPMYERWLAEAKQQLSPDVWDAAWAAGRNLRWYLAAAEAMV